MPPPSSPAERSVHSGVRAFSAEAAAFRRHLTRWGVDPRPAQTSLQAVNQHAWAVHNNLGRAPRMRQIVRDWARVVSVLRRLNQMLPSRGR